MDVLPATAGDDTVYLPALFDKSVKSATTVKGQGTVSVYFESFASKVKFFSLKASV